MTQWNPLWQGLVKAYSHLVAESWTELLSHRLLQLVSWLQGPLYFHIYLGGALKSATRERMGVGINKSAECGWRSVAGVLCSRGSALLECWRKMNVKSHPRLVF